VIHLPYGREQDTTESSMNAMRLPVPEESSRKVLDFEGGHLSAPSTAAAEDLLVSKHLQLLDHSQGSVKNILHLYSASDNKTFSAVDVMHHQTSSLETERL